jgi:plastocyanin
MKKAFIISLAIIITMTFCFINVPLSRADSNISLTSTPTYSWQFISQGSDRNLVGLSPGGTAIVTLTAKNTGTATWYGEGSSNPVHVGTTHPRDRSSVFNKTWLSYNRPCGLPVGTTSVLPGATVTFTWAMNVPYKPGIYREYFSLVADGITWMNDPGVNYYTIVNGNYSWQFISQTASTNLANLSQGQVVTLTLTAKNTGNTIWYGEGNRYPVRVGTTHFRDRRSAFDNANWLGPNRPVGLPPGLQFIAPGTTVTFTWTYTASVTAGTYREYFSLVAEGLTWMNDPGVNYYTVVH